MSIMDRVLLSGRVLARAKKLSEADRSLTIGVVVTNAERELGISLEEEEHGLVCVALFAVCAARPRRKANT